jgi:aspartyl-tRNA(Asn)/glutamyl-tRNA(Gln) amidotransferase subunit A
MSDGEDAGPLAGVPVGIKDLEDVAGLPTTFGSVPFKDKMAKRDSVHVARLKAAGAIIVGKTNTPEFGSTGFTRNLLFGVTRSPWNTDLTPGGSSGGSAAAVVSGMVPLATGTDQGGSLRIPASYSGCFGMKPSFGRIPRGPLDVLPWTDAESLGTLCGSVRDFATYLDCVAGYDPCDPDSLPKPSASYASSLDKTTDRLRIAWCPRFGGARSDQEVLDTVSDAVDAFSDLGHVVEPVDLDIPEVKRDWQAIASFARHGELFELLSEHRDDVGRAFFAGVEAGGQVTAKRYAEAQRARAVLNNALRSTFERFDLLLTPATATTAFDARGRLPESIAGEPVVDPLEVTPFTYQFNMSGHPAASVPAGLTVSGLPVGLQVVAERHRDDLVLQVCHQYEQARPWTQLWPDDPRTPAESDR